ncbi:MAG: hypothetical protein GY820_08495 [Gammaproteobacteria bacterium]|nr:hypothetical protein [Gammaproteobacteria bacterium]
MNLLCRLCHQASLRAHSGRQRTVPVPVPAPTLAPTGVFTPKIWAFGNRKVGSRCEPKNTWFFSANRDDNVDVSRFIRVTQSRAEKAQSPV